MTVVYLGPKCEFISFHSFSDYLGWPRTVRAFSEAGDCFVKATRLGRRPLSATPATPARYVHLTGAGDNLWRSTWISNAGGIMCESCLFISLI